MFTFDRAHALTHCDRAGVPCVVQDWTITGARQFKVDLFTGARILLDVDTVRDFSYRGHYERWDATQDGLAISRFVEFYLDHFLTS